MPTSFTYSSLLLFDFSTPAGSAKDSPLRPAWNLPPGLNGSIATAFSDAESVYLTWIPACSPEPVPKAGWCLVELSGETSHATDSCMRKLVTFAMLWAFWLALSGHYTPFLILCGVAVSVVGVWIAGRIGSNDEEGMPLQVFANIPSYYPWLVVEIAKSAWAVARIVLHPRLPVSPVMTVVKASQKSSTGVATYANSITLTPGTVTTGVRGKMLTVYALTKSGADDVEAGGMDARVLRFEAGP